MFKVIAIGVSALVISTAGLGTQAKANTFDVARVTQETARNLQTQTMAQAQFASGLNWKVGDQADYTVSIGGFINGTSHNFVREDIGASLWMVQDMDLGVAGKQMVEVLIGKATGKIEKLLVAGKEQTPPDAADQEVLEMHEDNVTVPAGSFPCIYVKIKSKKEGSIQEQWINPQTVPMSGLLKALADSQIGKVTQEATKFSFQK
jgi:hypothetical protein